MTEESFCIDTTFAFFANMLNRYTEGKYQGGFFPSEKVHVYPQTARKGRLPFTIVIEGLYVLNGAVQLRKEAPLIELEVTSLSDTRIKVVAKCRAPVAMNYFKELLAEIERCYPEVREQRVAKARARAERLIEDINGRLQELEPLLHVEADKQAKHQADSNAMVEQLTSAEDEGGKKPRPMDRLAFEMGQICGDKTIQVEERQESPPPIPRLTWTLVVLLFLDFCLFILWGWCLIGDQPDLMAYLQTVFTIVGVLVAILSIVFVARRPVVLGDVLHRLGTDAKWLHSISIVTALSIIITCLFWPLGWVGKCVPAPTSQPTGITQTTPTSRSTEVTVVAPTATHTLTLTPSTPTILPTATPTPTLTSTPTSTPILTSTASPTSTSTKTPTATYIPIPTFTPAPLLFFSDDFDGDAIDSSLWYTETAELSVQDGYLYVLGVMNEGQSNAYVGVEPKLDRQFSIIEFGAAVLHSEKSGQLSVLTSCGDDPSDTTLEISLGFDNRIWGGWHTVDKEIELPWHQPLDLGQVYNVRLVQDGDIVRAYVDGVEMPEPYPCASMGKWLVMRGITFPGGFVEGYFDYVRLSAPTSTLSPPSITVGDLIGLWKMSYIYFQFNEDGTFRVAYSLDDLEVAPFDVGQFRLEGTLLTLITGDESLECRGQSGSYWVKLTEQELLQFVLHGEDPCENRVRDLQIAPWSRISP